MLFDGYYYMTYTTSTNITILRSESLTDWNSADVKLAFDPPVGMNYSTDLWAPELHSIDGKWYIIFTGDPAYDTPSPAIDMCMFSEVWRLKYMLIRYRLSVQLPSYLSPHVCPRVQRVGSMEFNLYARVPIRYLRPICH